MPLSGSIDSSRALAVTESQLAAIERLGAHTVIVDVTGVPIVDTAVAGALVRTAEAARLLGAETVLVGLRPELAQTIVGLGVDLGRLVTRADLADGVRYALSRRTRLAQATSAG
jgi:rsbT co-antagonist protein RsbR